MNNSTPDPSLQKHASSICLALFDAIEHGDSDVIITVGDVADLHDLCPLDVLGAAEFLASYGVVKLLPALRSDSDVGCRCDWCVARWSRIVAPTVPDDRTW